MFDRLFDQAHDRLDGDAAGNLAGVVAAHAVGEYEQADVGVDADRVLVVLAHTTDVAQADRADLASHYRVTPGGVNVHAAHGSNHSCSAAAGLGGAELLCARAQRDRQFARKSRSGRRQISTAHAIEDRFDALGQLGRTERIGA